jgi:tRNA (cytidine/uridine-2'-O-)-methyltransferase
MKFTATSDDKNLKGHEPTDSVPSLFRVALVEPEIPQNTGNIGRTCVGLNARLDLVGRLGFNITDKNLRRAGLDYWQHLRWKHFENYADWEQTIEAPLRVFYFSAKAEKTLYDVEYQKGDTFVFGRETAGLDDDILRRNADRCLLIPIIGPVRGYNVATSVAMVLTEAYRQVRHV